MELVWMMHPDLPDQPVQVPDSSVPIHRASGWRTHSEMGEQEPGAEAPEAANLTEEDRTFDPTKPVEKADDELAAPEEDVKPKGKGR